MDENRAGLEGEIRVARPGMQKHTRDNLQQKPQSERGKMRKLVAFLLGMILVLCSTMPVPDQN